MSFFLIKSEKKDLHTFSHNLLKDIEIVFLSSSTQRRQLGFGNQLQKLREVNRVDKVREDTEGKQSK